jgi:hypothetical protein
MSDSLTLSSPAGWPPWTAPGRVEPPFTHGEREGLVAWLDYHRATLLTKCAGLTGQQLATRAAPPSTLTLLGLVRHLAEVENGWLATFDGEPWQRIHSTEQEPDGDLLAIDPATAAADLATYLEVCDRSRAIVAAHDLDDVSRDETEAADPPSMRWICLHLIEEYARHNGHADLLRERLDGATGE